MTVYTDENMKSNEGLTNFAFETKDEPGTDQQDTKSGETSTASLEASTMSLENGAVNESESNIDSDRSNLSLNNNSRRDAVLRVNSHMSTTTTTYSPTTKRIKWVESEKRRVKPPRRGVMASLWGCLGVKQTPSIKHTAGSNGVSKLEPDLPMPAEDELNRLFAEFVEELDLDRAHRKAMFDLADDKKWQIYCSKRKEQDDTAGLPDQYIEQIESLAANNILLVAGHESNEEAKQSFFDTLRTALRTQPLKFVITFINKGGLDSLLKYLSKMDYETLKTNVHSNVLACIKSLMNNDQGRSHVLAHPEAINIISQSLASDNIRAKISCIEILGAMCLVPGGHKKVLAAMLYFQKYAAERARFQTILNDLDRSSVVYKDRDELALKSTILSFINATLKYGSGQNSLEFRMHLRFEFLMLGLQTIIEKLKKLENSSLNKHIEFFELIRNVDDKEFSKRFDLLHVDTRSATSMFELLRKRLHVSTSYGHLLSILKHLLLLPNQTKGTQYWSLIDRLVQQVCLQQPDGSNPDIELAEIDVSKVVRQLAQESEVKSVQGQMRTIQKENDELMRQLNKKERECEAKTEEKDEVMGTLNDMKAKLEKEAAEVVTLTQTINTLQAQLLAEQQERQKLQEYVKTGNLPDDTKVGAMLSSSLPAITPPGGAPPPPPPGPGMPPPPPPPGPPGAPPPPGMMMKTAPKQKKVPKSSIPLKSFNWQKIGADKTANTVFDGLQDELVYKEVDLQDFEQQFSGYQHKDGSDKIVKHESKELSLIDGRRAQNCTILLSKLKMTSEELRKAILSVDHSEELAKDMVEQLLKFVPTQEETQMLTEHEDKKDTMARADRFLLDICKVPHYEQRLNALYYKKKFSDRMGDVKPKVTDLLDASKQLYSSKRIKHLFEIVLAYGNYMNKGNRGNAFGFKISSLNKIADTKSSQSREFNMLNYLLQLFHSQFRDLLQLENEIGKVKDAKRIALPELTKEVSKMGKELKEITKEIIYQKNHKTGDPHDRFVQVMSDFVTVASYKYSELESKFKEALEKFHKVVTYFGEDKDKAVPDEFFSVFSDFLDAMSFAEAENRRQLLKKKEEEKRALNEAQMKAERDRKAAEKRTQKNKTSGKSAGKTGSKSGKEEPVEAGGEFDDLISALTNGQVYEDHLNNMSNKKTAAGRKRIARQPSREDNSQASAFKSKYAQPVVR